jgi:hypothetical protein
MLSAKQISVEKVRITKGIKENINHSNEKHSALPTLC